MTTYQNHRYSSKYPLSVSIFCPHTFRAILLWTLNQKNQLDRQTSLFSAHWVLRGVSCPSSFVCCGWWWSGGLPGHTELHLQISCWYHTSEGNECWGGMLGSQCILESHSYYSCSFLNYKKIMFLNRTFMVSWSQKGAWKAPLEFHSYWQFLYTNKFSHLTIVC